MNRTRVAAAALAALLGLGIAACGSGGESSPSQSSEAAATPTATATASESPAASVATGDLERVVVEEGFAISLPPGWEAADLSAGDVEDMMEFLGDDPQLAPMADQVQAMLSSGVALFAVSLDAAGLEAGFATNLNVLVQENIGMSLDPFAAANASLVEDTFSVQVERETVSLPAGDAVRLEYEPTVANVGTYHVTQYLIVTEDGRAIIATFSRAADNEAADEDFAAIIETLEVSD